MSFDTPFHLILSLSKDEVEGRLRMRMPRRRSGMTDDGVLTPAEPIIGRLKTGALLYIAG
jgi:hypothetical protein